MATAASIASPSCIQPEKARGGWPSTESCPRGEVASSSISRISRTRLLVTTGVLIRVRAQVAGEITGIQRRTYRYLAKTELPGLSVVWRAVKRLISEYCRSRSAGSVTWASRGERRSTGLWRTAVVVDVLLERDNELAALDAALAAARARDMPVLSASWLELEQEFAFGVVLRLLLIAEFSLLDGGAC
jgi:hypothetical protein